VLEPAGQVNEVRLLDSLGQSVAVTLPAETMAGSYGVASYLSLRNLTSARGTILEESGRINLFRPVENLHDFILYPQPVRPGTDKVFFANLPAEAEIRIYNIHGKLIQKMEGGGSYGAVTWDLRDKNGEKVRSGIYIYEVRTENEKKYGKLAIVR